MAAYKVEYRLKSATEGMTKTEAEAVETKTARISASSASRALSAVYNELKEKGEVAGKADVVFLEARVVA